MYSSSSSNRMSMKALAAPDVDSGGATNRRRSMAMMKYGSSASKKKLSSSGGSRGGSSSGGGRGGSTRSSSRSRYSMEHRRKIAQATAADVEGFADFSAFGSLSQSSSQLGGASSSSVQQQQHRHRQRQRPSSSRGSGGAPAVNLFDTDPFAADQPPPSSLSTQAAAFTAEWPGEATPHRRQQQQKSMSTFPSNSSMQSSFPIQHSGSSTSAAGRHGAASQAAPPAMQTPERKPQHSHYPAMPSSGRSSPSPSYASSSGYTSGGGGGGGGGAAARRRVRNQMRSKLQRSETDPVMAAGSTPTHHAPPHSPKYRRHHSADSVGSSNANSSISNHPPSSQQLSQHRGMKPTDHVAHYSMSRHRSGGATSSANSFSNRSTSSHTNASGGRSVSSNSSSGNHNSYNAASNPPTPKEVNLFRENHPNAGFTFDAFGLDASQIQREVSEAMQDIAGSNPDLSFFLDPADDFSNAKGWDSSSPNPSRSSTPEPGAVGGDGFGVVTKGATPFNAAMRRQPHQYYSSKQQSPTSTERSSLTSETESSAAADNGRMNQFKEMARAQQATKKHRIVRPSSNAGSNPGSIGNGGFGAGTVRQQQFHHQQQQFQQRRAVPRMPDLDDSDQPVSRSFSQLDETEDEGGAYDGQQQQRGDSKNQHHPSNSSSPGPARATSDTGAPSDVGVASDFDVDESFRSQHDQVDVLSQLKRDKQNQQQQQQRQDEHQQRHRQETDVDVDEEELEQEEKKYDEQDSRRYEIQQQPSTPSVTSLRAQWQQRDAQVKEQPQVVRSSANTASAQRPRGSSATSTDNSSADRMAKSEAGAMRVNASQVNALMGSWRREEDAQSDVGTTPSSAQQEPSPAFATVKLRRTGFHDTAKDATASDKNGNRQQGLYGEDADANATTTTASSSKSPGWDGELDQQHHQADRATREYDGEHAAEDEKPKLSYRERREMELARQREEEERNQQHQANSEPQKRDVAELIRRRIAANKKNGLSSSDDQEQEPPEPSLQHHQRIMEEPQQQFSDQPQRVQCEQKAHDSHHKNSSNLALETRSPERQITSPNRTSAVSRLAMLEQIQQLNPAEPSETSAAPSASSSNYRPQTPDTTRDDHNVHKAHTPKATMMMLNAFLAGRDSLSADAGSNVRGSQSDEDHHDSSGSKAVSSRSSGSKDEAPKDAPTKFPALKDDPKYERYFTMLKIGMPMDVVKHAMTRDGLDPSVMDGDHNKPAGVPLKEDPLYTKYFKMLSFGLPMEAVKHAMERDGLDSSVMDQDHDLPVQNKINKLANKDDEPKEKDSHRRARLHWKPLRKVTSNSLWAKIDEDEEIGNIEIDEEEFQELFQVEKNSEAVPKASSSPFGPKRGAVRVIDAKRANNGGIILARLKMSHDDMADAVDRIDEHALTAEQIENIIEYLPTKEERRALETYMLEGGQDAAEKFDALCECEKFMVSMMTVKHAKRKVRALLFKLQFKTCLEDIHNDTVAVESACDELVNSVRLRQLLGIVLTFGNRLNTAGNGQRKAGAFTLDSLLKLNQAKAFDKKTTFLHYIVLIVQRNNEILLRFKDDIPGVFKADKIFWDQCVTDLEEVENQLENVRKIALHQARHAVSYRFRKKKHGEDDESLSDDEVSLSLEEEVEALRATPVGMFTLSAIKLVSSLRDRVEDTKAKYSRLLEYFGEEEGKVQPHELFNVIAVFSRDFEKAKEQVFANEKRKLREERKRQAKGKSGRPPTYSPAQPDRKTSSNNTAMLKSSNFQPSMSSVLKELKTRVPTREARDLSAASPPPPPPKNPNTGQNLGAITSPAHDSPLRPLPHAPSDEVRPGNAKPWKNSGPDFSREPAQLPQESMPTLQEVSLPPQQQSPRSSSSGGDPPPEDSLAPKSTPSKSNHRPISNSKAVLRQKARMRRNLASPPHQGNSNGAAAKSPPPASKSSGGTSQVMRMQMYSRSPAGPAASDSGAHQPLSPRSSIRRKLRHTTNVPS